MSDFIDREAYDKWLSGCKDLIKSIDALTVDKSEEGLRSQILSDADVLRGMSNFIHYLFRNLAGKFTTDAEEDRFLELVRSFFFMGKGSMKPATEQVFQQIASAIMYFPRCTSWVFVSNGDFTNMRKYALKYLLSEKRYGPLVYNSWEYTAFEYKKIFLALVRYSGEAAQAALDEGRTDISIRDIGCGCYNNIDTFLQRNDCVDGLSDLLLTDDDYATANIWQYDLWAKLLMSFVYCFDPMGKARGEEAFIRFVAYGCTSFGRDRILRDGKVCLYVRWALRDSGLNDDATSPAPAPATGSVNDEGGEDDEA
jgi:hypothetical protein